MSPTQKRIAALRRFALALTVFNIGGHLLFGFEQSYAQPLLAMAVTYSMELGLEWMDARLKGRTPAFVGGGLVKLVDFLLPAHITALAVAMLLYAGDELWPVAFAAAAAIGSKHMFRIKIGPGERHFFNPSNFGIAVTLLLFPRIGIAPPYMFSENLTGWLSWVLPAIILVSGTFINWRLTDRMPVLLAWAGGFAVQALVRDLFFGGTFPADLMPMTGLVFILFSYYMVTDPATTPSSWQGQVVFGAGVAAVYGLLVVLHVVFGFFFALTIVCAIRGLLTYATRLARENETVRRAARQLAPAVSDLRSV